tara:strand:- start:8175 stop:9395 length:1221 start_codon:yes stop_codon:yes gene_type:complete
MQKILIILSFSLLLSYDSYISFYGSGQKLSKLNPSNISLGWSNLFDSNNQYKIGSLSHFYQSDLVRFTMAGDFNFNSINDVNYYSQKFNYFSFLFPLKKHKYSLGISLAPFYRINSHIIESDFGYVEQNENNSAYAYKSEYEFDGGPSIASIMFSSSLFNNQHLNFSWGLKFNYIFGSLYSHVQNNIYNIDYDQEGNIEMIFDDSEYYTAINNYDGYGLEIEFSIKNKHHNLISSINLVDEININRSFYDDIVPEALELGISPDEETTYTLSSPFEFNIGYSFNFNDKNAIIFEYYYYSPYTADSGFNLFNNEDVNKNRLSMGYYRNLFDDKINFSTGLYHIEADNDFLSSNRKGMTFGLGIYFIKSMSIDFCIEIGQNKIEITNPLTEDYVNVYLGFTTSDRWFK